jgi:hypothetical protein
VSGSVSVSEWIRDGKPADRFDRSEARFSLSSQKARAKSHESMVRCYYAYGYLEDCSRLIPCNFIDDVISDGIPPTLCMPLVMLDFAVEAECCLTMDVQPARLP